MSTYQAIDDFNRDVRRARAAYAMETRELDGTWRKLGIHAAKRIRGGAQYVEPCACEDCDP